MKTELNPEDRARIEQVKNEVALKNGWNDWDSLVIWHRESGLMSELWEYIDEVAEYENKYQRERQANGLKSIENPGHHIKVLKEQIQRMEKEYKELEAERSELKELLWICQDFLPQGVGDESDYYDRIRARIKNSLKTK